MKPIEFIFKKELINEINANLPPILSLNSELKYTIDHITNMIISTSTKYHNRFKLKANIAKYFNKYELSRFSRVNIKSLVKEHILSGKDNLFFSTYVVIGHDIPIKLNELTVVVK